MNKGNSMRARMTLCRRCAERIRDGGRTELYEEGRIEGGEICSYCNRWSEDAAVYEARSKDADRQRESAQRKRDNNYSRPKDTRAYYREPWRET